MRTLLLFLTVVLAGCWTNSRFIASDFSTPPSAVELASVPAEMPHPVVLEGVEAEVLLGVLPEDVVAFVHRNGAWHPIPVQVDERFRYDLATVYTGMEPADCVVRAWCRDLEGHVELLGYADPGTHVGPDPEAGLDADDEIVLMLADFGDAVARDAGHPEGVDPASAVVIEREVEDTKRMAVLYRRTSPSLDPAAGRQYVRYRSAFERGTYRETYRRGGASRPPWLPWPFGAPSGERLGANPERTLLETDAYALGFADRWILNRLHLRDASTQEASAGGGWTADLLDLDMIAFAPGVCWRSPYTGSLSEGGILVNRAGPIRAIRHVVGFNSGPLVDQRWTFYARTAESVVTLRVHKIPGAMSFLDLSEAATGMIYRNATNPRGALVDGFADALDTGPVSWESWTHAAGAFAVAHTVEAEGVDLNVVPYHLDAAEPETRACMMDGSYYGAHGVYLDGTIPNTDPREGETATLALRRQFAFAEASAVALEALGVEAALLSARHGD